MLHITGHVICGSRLVQRGDRLASGFHPRVRGARMAIVDEAMSAGSALVGTYVELKSHGGVPVVLGALLVLESAGADLFAERGMPLEAVVRHEYELWTPAACPLCASRVPLDQNVVKPCRRAPQALRSGLTVHIESN